jgi:hypothetical protein
MLAGAAMAPALSPEQQLLSTPALGQWDSRTSVDALSVLFRAVEAASGSAGRSAAAAPDQSVYLVPPGASLGAPGNIRSAAGEEAIVPVPAADITSINPATAPAAHPALGSIPSELAALSSRLHVATASPAPGAATQASKAQIRERFADRPLYFERNVGQIGPPIDYVAHGINSTLFVSAAEATWALQGPGSSSPGLQTKGVTSALTGPSSRAPAPGPVVRMQVLGANSAAAVGQDRLPTRVNYFLGNDPAQWHTDIPTYGRVEYRDIYPGIHLAYYASGPQLEYDFAVAPGADPGQIRLGFAGADAVELDAQGDLVLRTAAGDVVQHKPVLYQDVNGVRKEVAGHFRLARSNTVCPRPTAYCVSTTVSFQVGAYDRSQPLVIDPVVLSYSTYLGGNSNDYGYGIAVDGAGSAYVTGQTWSTDFPTHDPFQSQIAADADAFVAKLSPDGSGLAYATYLGGPGSTCAPGTSQGQGIAVDAGGDAFVTGYTESCYFPTYKAFQPAFGGGASDAFVTKLSPAGNALIYSSFLGGTTIDAGGDIAVDPAGEAYIIGRTNGYFPIVNALQPKYGGNGDCFVSKVSADGSMLLFSTYLGGSLAESDFDTRVNGIAVDATGYAYVTGQTASYDFPVFRAFQPVNKGFDDAFVAKLRPDGSGFVYSTYLGGTGLDWPFGIAADAAGDAYVAGSTGSADFPVFDAYQPVKQAGSDAFLTKFNPDGSALVYSTYLGGSSHDDAVSVTVDAHGSAYLTGYTESADFPVTRAFQPNSAGNGDAFVTKFTPAGGALVYSSFLGGSDTDSAQGIAVDRFGDAYVTGATRSQDFPTVKPFQPAKGVGYDAFVAKVSRLAREPVTAQRP